MQNPCFQYLSAGKHVLCEKTLGLNDAQTAEIYRLATEKGVFMMEAMWSRFLPTWRKVKNVIKNGEIGKVRFAQSNFGYALMGNERVRNPDMGGGALWDIG